MKALLEFDLDNPEEKKEHLRCIHATPAFLALQDMDYFFRGMLKHHLDNMTDKEVKAYKFARNKLFEFTEERNISLEMLS